RPRPPPPPARSSACPPGPQPADPPAAGRGEARRRYSRTKRCTIGSFDPGIRIRVSSVSPLHRYSWASAPPPWAGIGIRVARPSPARTSTLPPESACDGCRTRVPLALVQVPLAAWVAVPRALRPPRLELASIVDPAQ